MSELMAGRMQREPALGDAYLVGRARAGYLDAYEMLIRRHSAMAYRVALRLCGDHHEAQDIAQESLIAAWQRLEGFRGDCEFSTWLYRIVTRQAINKVSRTRAVDPLDVVSGQPDRSADTAAQAERNLAMDAVAEALAQLPFPQRVAVVLHHLEGLSYAEVAAVTNSTVPAVRSHLFRARRTLGSALEAWR